MHILTEDNRNQFIAKSKSSTKGNERFKRRTKSQIQNTVQAMNAIDMDKLFKKDILTIDIPVHGETDNYKVKISYVGFLDLVKKEVQRSGICTLREVSRAAINAFNSNDIFINCSCPDYRYRYNYWRSKQGQNSAEPENRPSNITNPHDKLGSSCKHVLLVLSNNSWVLRVARVIWAYINYMEKHYKKLYANIIYPAIYDKEYEEPYQLSFDDMEDNDTLDSEKDIMDKAVSYNQQRTRFQKGNTQGVRFASSNKSNNDQISILSDMPDNEN